MIILIWLLIILVLTIIIGEARYRKLSKNLGTGLQTINSMNWKESVDVDLCKMNMEYIKDDFVNSTALAMRGSWRLAQENVMGEKTFVELRNDEYSKRLK